MGINLAKGERVNLSEEVPSLQNIGVGLGWDTNRNDSEADFDLDVSVFMLDVSGKVTEDKYFVFYNNLQSPDGAIIH
jgi:tellurium resistance protein TerD